MSQDLRLKLSVTCTNTKFESTTFQLLAQKWGSNPKLYGYVHKYEIWTHNLSITSPDLSSYLQKSDILTQNASITCTIVKFKPTTFKLPDLFWVSNLEPLSYLHK